jgi:hypothetical protein
VLVKRLIREDWRVTLLQSSPAVKEHKQTPRVKPEDVDEMMRLIDERKRPVRFEGIFD